MEKRTRFITNLSRSGGTYIFPAWADDDWGWAIGSSGAKSVAASIESRLTSGLIASINGEVTCLGTAVW